MHFHESHALAYLNSIKQRWIFFSLTGVNTTGFVKLSRGTHENADKAGLLHVKTKKIMYNISNTYACVYHGGDILAK
jgi:hypothetical protein